MVGPEHFFHNGLLLIGGLLVLSVVFKDFRKLNFKNILPIFLVLFLALHYNPFFSNFHTIHQAENQTTHPCCMPQAMVVAEVVSFSPPEFFSTIAVLPQSNSYENSLLASVNNRSPPLT